jgi:uridine kinase
MRLPTTPATTVLRELRDEVRLHYRAGRVILAVDGVDGAGQPAFADGLAEAFAEDGGAVYRASLADFQRPRAERLARGNDSAQGYYLDTFDLATLTRALLEPFRTGGSAGFQLRAFDADRDAPAAAQWTTAPRDAVLIVDGVFLLRPELRGRWDWSVWLQVSPEAAFARLASEGRGDADPAADANARVREAHERYARDAEPRRRASAIVENSDPDHPVRIFGDFC